MNDRSAVGRRRAASRAPPSARTAVRRRATPGRPRDAQLEYKAILANASIGIAFTRDRKFTLCNPKFAEMFGWKAEELIGQPGEVVYPSRESYEAMGAIAVPVLAAGRQLDVEWEVRRKDGSTFLARMIAKAVSATDTQKGTVWIVEDITVRKRHADEVARLLREQEAILDTASIGICFVRDRHIVRCNRRIEEMYGYAPGELNGQPTSVTYADEADYARGRRRLRPSWRAARRYTARDAGAAHATAALFWERVDRPRGGSRATRRAARSGCSRTSPSSKRAEEELQRVLAEQQAIANNVVIGIAFLRDRKIVRCNRRFEELFGYAPGEALGMLDAAVLLHRRGIRVERAASSPSSRRARRRRIEQWLRRKDGSGFWCRRTGRALEPGNLAKGYVWLFEDITERKRADREVQRMRARAGR